jgi:hypothetical protein
MLVAITLLVSLLAVVDKKIDPQKLLKRRGPIPERGGVSDPT